MFARLDLRLRPSQGCPRVVGPLDDLLRERSDLVIDRFRSEQAAVVTTARVDEARVDVLDEDGVDFEAGAAQHPSLNRSVPVVIVLD